MNFKTNKNQQFLAAQLMAIEMITSLLSSSNPKELSEKISEMVIELTGAKIVILITYESMSLKHNLLSVCPNRKKQLFENIDLSIFCPVKNPKPLPYLVSDYNRHHPIRIFLENESFKNLIRIPLRAVGEIVGNILVFDIHDFTRVHEIEEVFSIISSPIALAMKNSISNQKFEMQANELKILMNNMENIVKERTKELQNANDNLEIARLSALNLMQDAVESQKETEMINLRLEKEIKERIKAEEDIIISKQSYEAVINSVEEMIFIMDKDKRYLFVNDKVIKKYGYTNEELYHEKTEFLSAKDMNNYLEVNQILEKAYHGQPGTFEFWGMTKSGEVFPKEISATAGNYFGEKVIITVGREISERKIAENRIKSLLNEKDLLLKEVHHRIKNNMNTIISLLSLQSFNIKDIHAKNALEDAKNRVQSMMLLYDKLYRSKGFNEISVLEYFSPLIDEILNSFPNRGKVNVNKEIMDFKIEAKILFSLGIMLYEILSNSMKHAFESLESGEISVFVKEEDKKVFIEISDNGIGGSSESSFQDSNGFGMQLINLLAIQIDANLSISTKTGTKYNLEFIIE